MRFAGFLPGLFCLACAANAHATYSIVASDPVLRVLGAAGTSCLGGDDVRLIYRSVPGVAVLVAQARYDGATQREAVRLSGEGLAPSAVIAALASSDFDTDAAKRQYAIADASGAIAAFTGSETDPISGDLQGNLASIRYSVQGNLLTDGVLDAAARGFSSAACDLPERLMRALEAGAGGGRGDKRCVAAGIPSDSAFLEVVSAADGGVVTSLRVPTSGSDDPLRLLRVQFDAWRSQHPCVISPAPVAEEDDAGCNLARAPGGGAALTAALALCALHCARRGTRRSADRTRDHHPSTLSRVVRRAFVRAGRTERQ